MSSEDWWGPICSDSCGKLCTERLAFSVHGQLIKMSVCSHLVAASSCSSMIMSYPPFKMLFAPTTACESNHAGDKSGEEGP